MMQCIGQRTAEIAGPWSFISMEFAEGVTRRSDEPDRLFITGGLTKTHTGLTAPRAGPIQRWFS